MLVKKKNNLYISESASAINFMNENLSADSKILFWPNSGYLLDLDYIYVNGFITTMANPIKLYDSKEIFNELKRFGITHLAMTDNFIRRKLKETILSSEKIKIIFQDLT